MILFTIKSEPQTRGLDKKTLQVGLIKRNGHPYLHHWAICGGFVNMNEDLDTAARRELLEETGVKDVYMEQLYTFGAVHRDPRMRVIDVAYYAMIPEDTLKRSGYQAGMMQVKFVSLIFPMIIRIDFKIRNRIHPL